MGGTSPGTPVGCARIHTPSPRTARATEISMDHDVGSNRLATMTAVITAIHPTLIGLMASNIAMSPMLEPMQTIP